jgi:chorismate dehydratase
MRRLRVSAISFLNTAPLMWDFEHGRPPNGGPSAAGLAGDFEVSYTVPAQCAEELREGTADIGIIPAITYATIPDLVILPDAAIAAKGPVRSILLVSKVPREDVRTVAADTSSRSSVALAQVLFAKFWGGPRRLTAMEPRLEEMLGACDAGLLIGDPALTVDRTRYHVLDLAEEWNRLTGRPFVFAFWAARLAALPEARKELDIAGVFRQSRDHGLEPQSVAQIARQWAPRVGLSEAEVTTYLTRHVHYTLDAECLQGLELFFQYAVECGVTPKAPELRFLGLAAWQRAG